MFAYAAVFTAEAMLFLVAAGLAARLYRSPALPTPIRRPAAADGLTVGLDRA
ncbi:MAG TPA: hypothetical protein VES39_05930 [Rhodospirillales bacterium]|nr:hypothetical protein [Rhodospirillales bacterium]